MKSLNFGCVVILGFFGLIVLLAFVGMCNRPPSPG